MSKLAIICVDDEKIVLDSLRYQLPKVFGEKFTLEYAESGEEALDKINNSTPDLIVLDVVLPGKSGFEICRHIKADDSTKKIPIIICSTKGSEMDKFWGMKQGADAYIPKPVDKDELLSAVQKLIK